MCMANGWLFEEAYRDLPKYSYAVSWGKYKVNLSRVGGSSAAVEAAILASWGMSPGGE